MDKKVILLGILILALSSGLSAFIQPQSNKTQSQSGKVLSAVKTAQATESGKLHPIAQPQTIPVGRQVKVPILLYHYIGNNPDPKDKARDNLSVLPADFDEQMGYLAKNGYNPISLDTMIAGLYGHSTLPPKPIIITFDDGYIDLYFNAFPILRKYGFHAVAFIPTGLIGTKYYASWGQLQELESSGLFSFEAHSVSHANLPSLSEDQLIYEVTESKKNLQSKFGVPVNFIAYPYGTSNGAVVEAVKKAGYVGALGTWYSTIQSEGEVFNMPRVKVDGGEDMTTFASRL